jgi:hypothetical protein
LHGESRGEREVRASEPRRRHTAGRMRYVGRPSLGDSYLSTSPRFGGASFFSATFSPNCNDAVRGYMQPGASRQRQRIVARLPMAAMRRSIPGRTRQQRNEKPRRKAGAANIAEGEYDVRVRKGQVSSCHGPPEANVRRFTHRLEQFSVMCGPCPTSPTPPARSARKRRLS